MAKKPVSREEQQKAALRKRAGRWKIDPVLWLKDTFGDNIRESFKALVGHDPGTRTGLARHQEIALVELGRLVACKLKAHNFRSGKGPALTEREQWYADKIGISIQSGQGEGKDFFGALAMWWFLMCFGPKVKCMATATSGRQLKNVYWSEMAKTARMALKAHPEGQSILQEMFVRQTEKIFCRLVGGKPNDGSAWFLEAATINTKNSVEEQGEALAGRHEDYMLILADEASGIAEGVFKPLEGTLTGIVNIIICIFNPTRARGYAVSTQKADSPYLQLHWDGEKSDFEPVMRTRNQTLAKKYGKDSNAYRIRVRGLPPLVDSDTLIPQDWIEDAVERHTNELIKPNEKDPWMVGVDPAAGGDSAIVLRRRGGWVDPDIQSSNSPDTMNLVQIVADVLDDCGANTACFVDSIGIGKGVYDRLRELQYRRVYSVDVRKRPTEEQNPKFDGMRFRRLRDELWWLLRTDFEDGTIAIPDDQDLKDQLGCMKYREEGGLVTVSTKKEIKREGISQDWTSPDKADALMHTKAKPDRLFRAGAHKQAQQKKVDYKGVYMR